MKAKAIFDLLKQTFSDWQEDKAQRLGAALAYYTIFSLAPLLIIVIAVAGLFFGQQAAQGQVLAQFQGLLGQQGAQAIQTMIQNANKPSTGIIASIIGLVTLLLGATGLFGQLQDALNTIWEVQPKPGRGILGTLRDRLLSFTMVLGVAFLLLVSLVVSAMLAGLGRFMGGLLPVPPFVLEAVNVLISFVVITVLFAMIFKVLPDVKIAWRDVWIGAAVTALLFTIGKALIGLYLGNSSVASSYGAAGTLVVLLIWVYYSAQILFMGAEFTQVYANRYGSRVRPAENAVPVTAEARAQHGQKPEPKGASGTPSPVAAVAEPPPATLAAAGGRPRAGYGYVRMVMSLIGLLGFAVGLVFGPLRRWWSGPHRGRPAPA